MKLLREFLESFVVVVLVIAGLIGISYHTFKGGGWFEAAFGRFMAFIFERPAISVPIVLVVVFLAALWHDRQISKGVHSKRLPTIVLYVLMAAGVFFIGRYAIVGTL